MFHVTLLGYQVARVQAMHGRWDYGSHLTSSSYVIRLVRNNSLNITPYSFNRIPLM